MIRKLATVLFAVSCSAHAGQARIIGLDEAQGRSTTFVLEYGNGIARMNLPDQPESYLVYRDNSAYLVTERSGIPMVFDLKATLQQLGSNAGLPVPRGPGFGDIGRFDALKATGRAETVAGLKGEVYLLSWFAKDDSRQTDEVVLSGDPRLKELSEVVQTIARTVNEVSPASHREGQERFLALVKAKNLAILRYGKQMRVERVTTAVVPPERFELPTEPLLLPGLGGLLGG